MSKPKVVFGPWFGEFGWELARWNPACRYLANTLYKNHHKIVIAPMGHKIIYEFADEYIDISGVKYIPNMAQAAHKDRNHLKYWQIVKQNKGCVNVKGSVVNAGKKFNISAKKFEGTLKDKIKNVAGGKKILVFFPRQRVLNPQRNWPIDKWIALIKHYCQKDYHVFTFGGPEDKPLKFSHPNYTDYVAYDNVDELDLCISALNLAECGVAIQSGGIYISLYSCPKTVSFGIELHRNRLKGENHLNSKYGYYTLGKHWNFPVDFIRKNIDNNI